MKPHSGLVRQGGRSGGWARDCVLADLRYVRNLLDLAYLPYPSRVLVL
jgi:hypothetical protein